MRTLDFTKLTSVLCLLLTLTILVGCGSSDDDDDNNDDNNDVSPDMDMDPDIEVPDDDLVDISTVASKFYNTAALSVVINDTEVIITSSNLPDHKSAYYAQNNSLFEAYTEPSNPDFKINPNDIIEQNFVFTLPRFPEEATNKQATDFGAMGVAVNSVSFFNQNAAPGDDILEEVNTFDQYEGHPQQQGVYHYHLEPTWLTETISDDAFLGFLLDGFPVYGPVEDGVRLTNDDLDDYHGHEGVTADFPDGIYHYHVTDELPWINGDGYFGVPGTLTQ